MRLQMETVWPQVQAALFSARDAIEALKNATRPPRAFIVERQKALVEAQRRLVNPSLRVSEQDLEERVRPILQNELMFEWRSRVESARRKFAEAHATVTRARDEARSRPLTPPKMSKEERDGSLLMAPVIEELRLVNFNMRCMRLFDEFGRAPLPDLVAALERAESAKDETAAAWLDQRINATLPLTKPAGETVDELNRSKRALGEITQRVEKLRNARIQDDERAKIAQWEGEFGQISAEYERQMVLKYTVEHVGLIVPATSGGAAH
jgi:hypothetical protein